MLCGDIFNNRFALFGNYKKQKADMKRCGICGSPRDSPNIGRYVHTMYSRRCNAICSLPRHRCFGFEFVRFTSWFTFRIIVISAFVMNAHKPDVLLGHIYANRRPQTVYWCRSFRETRLFTQQWCVVHLLLQPVWHKFFRVTTRILLVKMHEFDPNNQMGEFSSCK